MSRWFVFVLIYSMLFPSLLFAELSNDTVLNNTQHDQYSKDANRWGLSVEEWSHYKEIMEGEGQYHWPNADPITVLGIYAKNDAERSRYAELLARTEFRLQSSFIALNDAYVKAFQRLYSDQAIIDLAKMSATYRDNSLTASMDNTDRPHARSPMNGIGDRYVLFVSPDCAACRNQYERIRSQQRLGSVLDIYFLNADKSGIINWANQMRIDPGLVKEGVITLNPGNDVYAQFERPPLPAAFYFNGQTEDISPLDSRGVE